MLDTSIYSCDTQRMATTTNTTEPAAKAVQPRSLLTTSDIAFRLGCSLEKARELCNDGHIRTLPGFHQYRTTKALLDAYLEGEVA